MKGNRVILNGVEIEGAVIEINTEEMSIVSGGKLIPADGGGPGDPPPPPKPV